MKISAANLYQQGGRAKLSLIHENPLGITEIRSAPYATATIEPRLPFDPLKGFDAVLSFMVERVIVPAGIIAATRPLNDDRNLIIMSSAACRGKSWLGCLSRGSDAGPRRG